MAHRTNAAALGPNVAVALVTITSYATGGEQFTLAEFGLSGVLQSIFFLSTSGVGNPELQCKYQGGGIVKLFIPGSAINEFPTTASMSFQFLVVVTITGS